MYDRKDAICRQDYLQGKEKKGSQSRGIYHKLWITGLSLKGNQEMLVRDPIVGSIAANPHDVAFFSF